MITQTAKYSFKALAYLAQQDNSVYLQARDIAAALDIPANYLGKTLQKLTRWRLLDSQKGLHGGFRLSRASDQISVYDVLLALDAIPDDVVEDGPGDGNGPIPPTFFVRVETMNRAYMRFLRQTTLADMLSASGAPTCLTTATCETEMM